MANPRLEIIERLFRESNEKDRCPYIRKDEIGPYCGKSLAMEISDAQRMICDYFSLQSWCLSPDYRKCIVYQSEEVR